MQHLQKNPNSPSHPLPTMPAIPASCVRALLTRFVLYLLPALVSAALAWFGLWLASGLLFWGAFAYFGYGTVKPRCRFFGPIITHLPEAQAARREVWLTIDDGPDPATTPALLALLEAHQARAGFFLIGEKARRHPELVRQIAAQGHLIANHSQTHPAAGFWALSPTQLWREITTCQDTLRQILGTAPQWFRPPVGHHNAFLFPLIDALHLRLAIWSCRGYDAVKTDPAAILRLIERDLRPGAIILLHDATPHAPQVLSGVLTLLKKHRLTAALPSLDADAPSSAA